MADATVSVSQSRRLVAECAGTAMLLAAVVGSGIMGERLSGGNVAGALLANTLATGAALVSLILTFGSISGAHFNPADDGVGYDRDDCGCAYRHADEKARGDRSLMWTRAHVSSDGKAFLRSLVSEIRFEADGKRVLLVHGSPRKMNEYLFEDRPISSFQRLAAASTADIIVYGHTHKPYTKAVDNVRFINAGSVGKPKDGDWRACYAILEPASAEPVTFVRVPYDVQTVTDAIRHSELPTEFADDLEQGGAPSAAAHANR